VVDVGCGTGAYHPELSRRGVRIIAALDASAGMVQATQRRALDEQLPVVVLQGDATALPFPDGGFDLAMANHMLFHVADQAAALREIRRVLKPGGRFVASANSLVHGVRLRTLHDEAARELGYTPSALTSNRFNLDEHGPLLERVFPTVERIIRHDAFVFPSVEPAIRYYASGPVDAIEHRPADNHHREPLLRRVHERVAEIIAREGEFRDPKDVGCFVAYT
jgi:ubiquinone/menaquinone biosynthesis C-methylase UbiE